MSRQTRLAARWVNFHDKAVDLIAEVVAQFFSCSFAKSITSSIVLQTLRLLFTRKPAFSSQSSDCA